jgi:hypothetical protein
MSEYVLVHRFWNLSEAQAAQSRLEAGGLSPRTRDQYFAGLNWFYIPVMNGVRLEVPADQLSDAREILAEEREPVEYSAEERAYLEAEQRRRRVHGLIFVLLMQPLLAVAIAVAGLGWWWRKRRG